MTEEKTMSKEEFLEAYKLHQEWLKDDSKGKRFVFKLKFDFKFEFDFRLNLQRADMSEANMRGADMRWANMSGADMSGADMRWADMSEANMRGADMHWANMSGADMSEADMRGADIDYSAWPLSCKTIGVKLCKKLQSQLLYHAFINSEIKPTQEQLTFIEENFHRYGEVKALAKSEGYEAYYSSLLREIKQLRSE